MLKGLVLSFGSGSKGLGFGIPGLGFSSWYFPTPQSLSAQKHHVMPLPGIVSLDFQNRKRTRQSQKTKEDAPVQKYDHRSGAVS